MSPPRTSVGSGSRLRRPERAPHVVVDETFAEVRVLAGRRLRRGEHRRRAGGPRAVEAVHGEVDLEDVRVRAVGRRCRYSSASSTSPLPSPSPRVGDSADQVWPQLASAYSACPRPSSTTPGPRRAVGVRSRDRLLLRRRDDLVDHGPGGPGRSGTSARDAQSSRNEWSARSNPSACPRPPEARRFSCRPRRRAPSPGRAREQVGVLLRR